MRGTRRAAWWVLLVLLLAACAGGGRDEPLESWMAFDVRASGDALVTIARPGRPSSVTPLPGMFAPGPAPVFIVDPASVGRPGSRAIEVCLPVVDVDVTVTRGPSPIVTQGCWVLAADQVATFRLHPEPWRLPLGIAGVGLALGLAIVAVRRPPVTAGRWATAALAAAILTGLAASHAETAATVAGAFGGPAVFGPAALIARLGWVAAVALATIGLVRAARGRHPAPVAG